MERDFRIVKLYKDSPCHGITVSKNIRQSRKDFKE
jgi:hypothetical protein